jgi:hypothetical protein
LRAPGYVIAWIETGSPLYPLSVQVAGRTLLAGNEQLQRLYAGTPEVLEAGTVSGAALLHAALRPDLKLAWQDYHGLGPALLLLVPAALVALWRQVSHTELRVSALAVLALAAVPTAGIMSDSFAGQRTLWGLLVVRLLVSLPAALILLAAQVESRSMPWLWSSAIAIELAVGVPGGVTTPMRHAMVAVLPPLAAVAVTVVAAVVAWRRRWWWGWSTAIVGAGLFIAGATLERARRASRMAIYAALCDQPPAFIVHGIKRAYAGAWPVWRALDGDVPWRIALAAGWDGIGHNVFRYPLLGSNLQNQVSYVPITRDASIVDYERADEVQRRADVDAWLARLVERQIDVVVVLDPPPPEAAWMEARPALFERIASGIPGTSHAAFRFKPPLPRP